jgi:hypothetical protein
LSGALRVLVLDRGRLGRRVKKKRDLPGIFDGGNFIFGAEGVAQRAPVARNGCGGFAEEVDLACETGKRVNVLFGGLHPTALAFTMPCFPNNEVFYEWHNEF